jgi:DsbC/DsbD-like thiol-disulfide interchange protein
MLLWLLAGWLAAFQTPAPSPPIETNHLTVTLSAGPLKAGRLPLYVDVVPKEKMHVYAPGQPGYVAIVLTLDADAPVTAVGKAKYPAGEKLFMPVLNETQLVYGKPFRITQDVALRKNTAPGPLTIKGSVRYQACDDTICYKPATIALSWTLVNPGSGKP